MMRTVAEALANVKGLMDRMQTREVSLVEGGIYIRNNLIEIRSAIRGTVGTLNSEEELLSALNKYTGGKSYSATAYRSSAETEAARGAVWVALRSYRDVLEDARPNETQLIIRAVDDTQVAAPF